MSSPSQSFEGLRVRDKTGADTTSITMVVSRKGVKLQGTKGVLGNFPFQSITSWSHAADDALSLVVTVADVRREVILAGPPPVVTAVLQAIDSTVNDILQDMTEPPNPEPAAATYATPAPSPAEQATKGNQAPCASVPRDEQISTGVSKTDAAVAEAPRAAERASQRAAERAEHTERALAARERAVAARERAVAEAEVTNVLRESSGNAGSTAAAEDSRRSELENALARVNEATKDAEVARAEAVSARADVEAMETRARLAENRAELAEARATAAESRAGNAETMKHPEASSGPDDVALEEALRTIETLRVEVRMLRAESHEARATAGNFSSSVPVNAAAAASRRLKDGDAPLDGSGSPDDSRGGATSEGSGSAEAADAASAAATAAAVRSETEAESLRVERNALRVALRKAEEEKDASALDAALARRRASASEEDARALANELEAAKREASNVARAVAKETSSRELDVMDVRERCEARLAAANEAARALGVEKGEALAETENARGELERCVKSREVLERRLDEAAEQRERLRAELAASVASAAKARKEADEAFEEAAEARAELEALRSAADDVGERLDAHARESETEAVALTAERDRLVEALRASTAHLDAAERRAADADARAAAANGAREGVAAGAKRAARLAASDLETARAAVRAAEKKCENAVHAAEEARDFAAGLKVELDETRAARDAFAAEAREALAQRDAAERRCVDAYSAKEEVDAMAAEAEEALRRARRAERDAAEEIASLRRESEALARRVERQRSDEDAMKRRREIEGIVERLGLAEREVLQRTSRNAVTMQGLERSVEDLARSFRTGESTSDDATRLPLAARAPEGSDARDDARDDRNDARDGNDARDEDSRNGSRYGGLLTLSQPITRRREPWFPEVDVSFGFGLAKPFANFEKSDGHEKPCEKPPAATGARATASHRWSLVDDFAVEAGAAAAAARSVRDSRKESVRAASRGGVVALFAAKREVAEETEKATRGPETPSAFRDVSKTERDRFAAEARVSLEQLRAANGDRPDWQIRLELIEAENERTRVRLERARLGRAEEEGAGTREDPKPREASPPQPWR
jgi:hypothetical protein